MKILGDCQGKIKNRLTIAPLLIIFIPYGKGAPSTTGKTMKTPKKLKNWLYSRVYPRLLTGIIRFITATLRIETIGEESALDVRRKNRRIVYTVWHGRHFLVIPKLGSPAVCVLTSTSRDGTLLADILKRFGFNIIPGSSHKSPVRALLTSIQRMKEGKDLLFAVDGPTGPIYEFKPGALFVAKKADAFIVPLTFSYKPAICFKSWDRYMFPLPFSKAKMVFGETFKPSDDLTDEVVERERLQIQETMNRLTSDADRLVGY
jgi:lysophospholipid acyltransferase (LPLAT)-like uncharacterized protein